MTSSISDTSAAAAIIPPATVARSAESFSGPKIERQNPTLIEFDGNGRLNTRPFYIDGVWEISWLGDLAISIREPLSGQQVTCFQGRDGSSFVPKGGDPAAREGYLGAGQITRRRGPTK
jgi:hypothetical protein